MILSGFTQQTFIYYACIYVCIYVCIYPQNETTLPHCLVAIVVKTYAHITIQFKLIKNILSMELDMVKYMEGADLSQKLLLYNIVNIFRITKHTMKLYMHIYILSVPTRITLILR